MYSFKHLFQLRNGLRCTVVSFPSLPSAFHRLQLVPLFHTANDKTRLASSPGSLRVSHSRLGVRLASSPGSLRVSHLRLGVRLASSPGSLRVSHWRCLLVLLRSVVKKKETFHLCRVRKAHYVIPLWCQILSVLELCIRAVGGNATLECASNGGNCLLITLGIVCSEYAVLAVCSNVGIALL